MRNNSQPIQRFFSKTLMSIKIKIVACSSSSDRKLRCRMDESAWVEREEVVDSPADFSSMSDEIIRGLSGRGEALTRALAT